MYASNKYDRELLRVPQNYAGNAFAPPRQTPGEEHVTPTHGLDGVMPHEEPHTRPSASEEAALGEDVPAKEGTSAEATAAMAAKEQHEIAEEKRPPSGESGSPWGLGREELLLLGLMALTHGERQEREEHGGEGRDEIGLLLMLLLLLG